MVVISDPVDVALWDSCESLDLPDAEWTSMGAISINTVDQIEGSSCLQMEAIDLPNMYSSKAIKGTDRWDLSQTPIIRFRCFSSHEVWWRVFMICGEGSEWNSLIVAEESLIPAGQWLEYTIDLRYLANGTPINPEMLKKVRLIPRFSCVPGTIQGYYFLVDFIEMGTLVSAPPIIHPLTINSSPLQGVPINIDNIGYVTPAYTELDGGEHTLEAPRKLMSMEPWRSMFEPLPPDYDPYTGWDRINTDTGSYVEADDTIFMDFFWSSKCVVTLPDAQKIAYTLKNFREIGDGVPEMWMCQYFTTDVLPNTEHFPDPEINNRILTMTVVAGDPSIEGARGNVATAGLWVDDNDRVVWVLGTWENGEWNAGRILSLKPAPAPNRWYYLCLYVKIHPTKGEYRLYVDGELVLRRANIDNTGRGYPFRVFSGISHSTGQSCIVHVDTVSVEGVEYTFKRWADGPTNPTRTILLEEAMELEARYEPPTLPSPKGGAAGLLIGATALVAFILSLIKPKGR